MFTCENCHREKPNRERVSVNRWLGFVIEIMSRLNVSVVCRSCSGRFRRLEWIALVGLVVISIVTVVVLDFVSDYL